MEDLLRLPALGMVAGIGDIYDFEQARFLTIPQHIALKLQAHAISRSLNPHTTSFSCQYFCESTLHEKFDVFGIPPKLQLHILSQSLDVRGSSRYIYVEKDSAKAVRAGILCTVTNECVKSDDPDFWKKINHRCLAPYISGNSYKYIVTEITYGRSIVITVEVRNENMRRLSTVVQQLTTLLTPLADLLHDGKPVSRNCIALTEQLLWTVYLDGVEHAITCQTYDDVIHQIENFRREFRTGNKRLPLCYTLVPLKLCLKEENFFYTIGEGVIFYFVNVFEALSQTRQRLYDLHNTMQKYKLRMTKGDHDHLDNLQKQCQTTLITYRKALADTVQNCSGGGESLNIRLLGLKQAFEPYKYQSATITQEMSHLYEAIKKAIAAPANNVTNGPIELTCDYSTVNSSSTALPAVKQSASDAKTSGNRVASEFHSYGNQSCSTGECQASHIKDVVNAPGCSKQGQLRQPAIHLDTADLSLHDSKNVRDRSLSEEKCKDQSVKPTLIDKKDNQPNKLSPLKSIENSGGFEHQSPCKHASSNESLKSKNSTYTVSQKPNTNRNLAGMDASKDSVKGKPDSTVNQVTHRSKSVKPSLLDKKDNQPNQLSPLKSIENSGGLEHQNPCNHASSNESLKSKNSTYTVSQKPNTNRNLAGMDASKDSVKGKPDSTVNQVTHSRSVSVKPSLMDKNDNQLNKLSPSKSIENSGGFGHQSPFKHTSSNESLKSKNSTYTVSQSPNTKGNHSGVAPSKDSVMGKSYSTIVQETHCKGKLGNSNLMTGAISNPNANIIDAKKITAVENENKTTNSCANQLQGQFNTPVRGKGMGNGSKVCSQIKPGQSAKQADSSELQEKQEEGREMQSCSREAAIFKQPGLSSFTSYLDGLLNNFNEPALMNDKMNKDQFVDQNSSCCINEHFNDISVEMNEDSSKAINILILGESGVGKSTWINGIANYTAYNTMEEAALNKPMCVIKSSFLLVDDDYKEVLVCMCPDADEKAKLGTSSTQYSECYEFSVNGQIVRLIDTPGIGDTRGVDKDKENFGNILSHLSRFKDLHGICILLKPNSARMNAAFQFCINELLAHLHKDACKNIVFVFTNSRGTFYRPGDTLPTLGSLLLENKNVVIPLDNDRVYCMDNEPVRFLAAMKQGITFNDEDFENYSKSWKVSKAESNRLLAYILHLQPHLVKHTLLLNKAVQLGLSLAMPFTEISKYIQREILKAEKYHEEKLKIIKKMEEKNAGGKFAKMIVCGNKYCKMAKSNKNNSESYSHICHRPCWDNVEPRNEKLKDDIKKCTVMNSKTGFCHICDCYWGVHLCKKYKIDPPLTDKTYTNVKGEILEAERFITQSKDEQKLIFHMLTTLDIFIKQNAIRRCSDVFKEHLEQCIEKEGEIVSLGGRNEEFSSLTKVMALYETESRCLLKEMQQSRTKTTFNEIHERLGKLCASPIYGDYLRRCIVNPRNDI